MVLDLKDPEDSRHCHESREEGSGEHSEQDLNCLSGDAQVTSTNIEDIEDENIPAMRQEKITATEAHHFPVNHLSTMPNEITTQAIPPVPPIDATDSQFTIDAPETQAGQK